MELKLIIENPKVLRNTASKQLYLKFNMFIPDYQEIKTYKIPIDFFENINDEFEVREIIIDEILEKFEIFC